MLIVLPSADLFVIAALNSSKTWPEGFSLVLTLG